MLACGTVHAEPVAPANGLLAQARTELVAQADGLRAAPTSSALPQTATRVVEQARQRLTDAPAALWEALAAGRHAEATELLQRMERVWAMDPAYNALLAEAALAASRPAVATLALERLVLLEPNNAGAWLDLATTSAALGDAETALRALDALESGFPIPPGIGVVIRTLRARLASDAPGARSVRWRAGLMFGHDSNVNGGLAARSLLLTPVGGPVELPVDQAYRPRPSNQWLATVDAVGALPSPLGTLEWRAAFSDRQRLEAREFDTREASVAVAGSIGERGRAYWLAEFRRMELGGQLLLNQPRLRATREFPEVTFGCIPSASGEVEVRRHRAGLSPYDARIFWVDGGLRCPAGPGAASAVLRLGDDRGGADRPGGNARRHELSLAWQGTLRPGLDLLAGVTFAGSRDAQGYSPLLADGAARTTDRVTTRAELTWKIAGPWRAVAAAEHTRQGSNLGLFGLSQTVLMTGLRWLP